MTYELWRLVAIRDEGRSTWELVGRFSTVKSARVRLHELAGKNILSPEEDTYWYEDLEGVHTFRIEAVPAPAPEPG